MRRGMTNKPITGFNSGEWSPKLDGRIDIENYNLACKQLQNFILAPEGGAFRRAGTQFVAEAKHHDKKCRMIEFSFSVTNSFAIEMGDRYIRFYAGGAQIIVPSATGWVTSTAYVSGDTVDYLGNTYYCLESHTSGTFFTDLSANKWAILGNPGDPYEVFSPYLESELFDVQVQGINDIMYFSHPNREPYKLIRVQNFYWTMKAVAFKDPPFLAENLTDTTITPSATTGTGISLTASADIFESGHSNSYWRIGYFRDSNEVELALSANGNSSTIKILGPWEFQTFDFWEGTIKIQRSLDGSTNWQTVRVWTGNEDTNILTDGDQQDVEYYYRINFTNYTAPSGSPVGRARLEAVNGFVYGYVKITSVTDGQNATADVIEDLEGTSATTLWSEGAWSSVRGYPRAVGTYEQRILYAGTQHQPQTFWGSVTGDFENFRSGTNDDDSFNYTLGANERNRIEWLVGHKKLIIGTNGGEWTAGTGRDDIPITPSNVVVRRHATYGSESIQARAVNEVILMVQRTGRKIRELVFDAVEENYKAPDMTLLAEHLSESGITQIAYQQEPDSILWAVNNDGDLLAMTYERDQKVVGWSPHRTDGIFESVATIFGASDDEIWVSVNRTIGGSTKRYIERVNPTLWANKEDAFYVDSGLSITSVNSGNITGISNARPAVVTVDSTSGLVSGDKVRHLGIEGMTEANGDFSVKNVTGTTYELWSLDGTVEFDSRAAIAYTVTSYAYISEDLTLAIGTHHFNISDRAIVVGSLGTTPPLLVLSKTATSITVAGAEAFPIGIPQTVSLSEGPESYPIYTGGGTWTEIEDTFTGLSHLEGKTVQVLGDGAVKPDVVVSGGQVTIQDPVSVVHIGLGYDSILEPMHFDVDPMIGPHVGQKKIVREIVVNLYRSLGLKYGDGVQEDPLSFRDTNDAMDASPPLFTGTKRLPMDSSFTFDGRVVLRQDQPLPCNILSLAIKARVTGN